MPRTTDLTQLKNIGDKLVGRLNEVGLSSHDDLMSVGAVVAHRRIWKRHPNGVLPVCSLELPINVRPQN